MEMDRDANALAASLVVTETVVATPPSALPPLTSPEAVREEEELRRRGSILPSHLGPVALWA